jgi:predicted XRE-type DNA-binding protein
MKDLTTTENMDGDFVVGSGNFLKDRGYADPAEARAKFLLANQIALAVGEVKISQAAAAEMTGLKQPDISRIVNGNVKEYSVWRLMNTLKALGYEIAIEVRRPLEGKGRISIRDKADEGIAVILA